MIDFGLKFAEYAKAALASSTIATQIKVLNKEIVNMVFETEKFERIVEFYNNQDAFNYYANAGERATGNVPEFARISEPVAAPQVQTTQQPSQQLQQQAY